MVNKIKTTTALFVGATLLFITLQTRSDEKRLKEISKEYLTYQTLKHKITDSIDLVTWTPFDCFSPKPGSHPDTGSFALSKATATMSRHGNKLYRLYIKDHRSYTDTTIKEQPVGQVIVKETWVTSITGDHDPGAVQNKMDHLWYVPSFRSELFVMYKEEETDKNDKGWIYGVVDVEKNGNEAKVLTQGKISSCIGCHSGTKYDRIFGVKQ